LFVLTCSYVKSGQLLFANAEEAYRNKDEERAYVLYMRYFNVIQRVKKSAEYKKNKVTVIDTSSDSVVFIQSFYVIFFCKNVG